MKVKYIHLADARGKIGGAVASRNRNGSYFRSKTSPVNPDTTYQGAVRNNFTANSQAWRSLTDVQRLAWVGAVEDFKKSNVFGDLQRLSGSQLYNRINGNIKAIGGVVIATPPTPAAVTPTNTLSIDADVSDATIVLTLDAAVVASQTLLVSATPPVSPGVSFVKNLYRDITTLVNADGATPDITTEYEAKFGSGWKVAGKTFYVRVKPIITLTGIDGQPLSARAVVVA